MIQRGSGQPPRVRSTFPPRELYSDSGRPFGAPSRQTPVKPRACMSVYGGLVPLGLSHSSFLRLTIWYHIRKPLAIPFETTAKREICVWRSICAKRLGFPRGEAVERSETDEDRRYLKIPGAVREKAPNPDTICPVFVPSSSQTSPILIRPSVRTGAPSPRGKV